MAPLNMTHITVWAGRSPSVFALIYSSLFWVPFQAAGLRKPPGVDLALEITPLRRSQKKAATPKTRKDSVSSS